MKYCSMCGAYYNEPQMHRLLECPYYNGCACGLKMQSLEHFDKCFMMRERKRKQSDLNKRKEMLSNGAQKMRYCPKCEVEYDDRVEPNHTGAYCQYYLGCRKCGKKFFESDHIKSCKADPKEKVTHCWNCEMPYTGLEVEHRMRACLYYNGCPHCQKKYFERGHVKRCKESHESAVKGSPEPQYRCTDCGQYIYRREYDNHRRRCVGLIIVGESEPEPEEPKEYCGLCGSWIIKRYWEGHKGRCANDIKYHFSRSKTSFGEPRIRDQRTDAESASEPAPQAASSKSDLKSVKFKEG